MTYWLELNTGWRRNDADTQARHAGSEPTNGRTLCPAPDEAEGYLDSQPVRETPYEKTQA